MRLFLALGLGVVCLYGQTCVPGVLLPAGQTSGALDSSSCQLSDGTAYTSYQLTLPVRGQARIALDLGSANLGLILRDSTGAQLAAGLTIQRPLEPGAYTVLVNGQKPGQVGPFNLQTGFTPEPGMLCTAFPLLGIAQSAVGLLGASGCTAPDGSPYEAYRLNTFGSGTLTVTLTADSFTPVISVRDTAGYLLASAPSTVTVAVDAGTSYRLVVSSADTAGSFRISTAFEADPLDTCAVTKALGNPDSDQNSIGDSSCSMAADAMGDLVYYNFYSLAVPAAGAIDVSATSTDFQPALYLLDAAGNQVAADTVGGGANQSEIRMQLSPGNYTVEVVTSQASGGNYSLTSSFTPGSPQPCQPAAAAAGSTATGTLSSSSCRTALGLADLYTIVLPSDGTLAVSLAASTFAGRVALRDTKDNLLALNEDGEGLGTSQISLLLPAGTYTILAAAATGSGSYGLTPAFTAKTIPSCTQIPELAIANGGYIQNLGAPGCVDPTGQPADLFQFTLPSDGVVAAIMTSNEVPGFLTLTDSAGNFLRGDRNSYAPNDPLIVQFLPAGTYRMAARSTAAIGGGLYQISLLSALAPRPPFCAPSATLALGGTVSSTLTFTSCQYIDGTFADLYQVVLPSDSLIDLKLQSGDFDASLVLLDAKGNLVATDDDSGGGTDARIVQPLAAGTYFAVAKPFANYYSVGAYTLSLSQAQAQ